jgi:hypothetical protein
VLPAYVASESNRNPVGVILQARGCMYAGDGLAVARLENGTLERGKARRDGP